MYSKEFGEGVLHLCAHDKANKSQHGTAAGLDFFQLQLLEIALYYKHARVIGGWGWGDDHIVGCNAYMHSKAHHANRQVSHLGEGEWIEDASWEPNLRCVRVCLRAKLHGC